MVVVIGFLLALSILLPLAFIWRLWWLNEPTRLGWLLALAETVVLLALIGLLNRWDIAGFWTRAALAALAVAAALVSLPQHWRRP